MGYLGTALAAAFYWVFVAWLCFSIAGADPIDALTASISGPRRFAVAGLVLAFIIGFAFVGRSWHARRGGGDG